MTQSATTAPPLTYRIATVEEVPQVVELLVSRGLHWPGELATPYVAVREDGKVVGVFFLNLCLHAEPLAAITGEGVSVTEIAALMKSHLQELADERGGAITVYSFVQDNPAALASAEKQGMTPKRGLVLHELSIHPAADPSSE